MTGNVSMKVLVRTKGSDDAFDMQRCVGDNVPRFIADFAKGRAVPAADQVEQQWVNPQQLPP